MKKYLFFIFFTTWLTSCNKEEKDYSQLPNGVYVGTFQRELSWSDNYKSNIRMIFSSKSWKGSSDMTKYPALCQGTYSINGDTISFENDCAWSTEFDGGLILSGKFVMKSIEDSIEFHRTYLNPAGTSIDRYKLKRQ